MRESWRISLTDGSWRKGLSAIRSPRWLSDCRRIATHWRGRRRCQKAQVSVTAAYAHAVEVLRQRHGIFARGPEQISDLSHREPGAGLQPVRDEPAHLYLHVPV